MALSPEFREYVLDHFSELGPVEIKRMFGGAGLYLGDACFALVLSSETILMRGDDDLGPEFEAAGSEQWIYENKTRGPVSMPYWTLPDAAMDDPEEAVTWARKSLVPAEQAAAKKRAAKARKAARKPAAKT
ncbi:MAG: TfoX/Sxy family protein [Pseudomonadota bacterium]